MDPCLAVARLETDHSRAKHAPFTPHGTPGFSGYLLMYLDVTFIGRAAYRHPYLFIFNFRSPSRGE